MLDPRKNIPSYSANNDELIYSDESYVNFYEIEAITETGKGKYWYGRGQNFVIIYAELKKGEIFSRAHQIDEFCVIQPDRNTKLNIKNDVVQEIKGFSITFIPPGESCIEVLNAGRFIFIFSSLNEDLLKFCANNSDYYHKHYNLPVYECWPEPINGYKVRSYSLDVPNDPNRFGKIWRCTNFMISFVPQLEGPRDITKLSPHSHDDFEQCSFVLDGEFTHHIRYPWTPNKTNWKLDKHITCKAPSMMVIPAKAIHTSCAISPRTNQLIDIFSPPRLDFSRIPGWVLNSDEYPLPIDI